MTAYKEHIVLPYTPEQMFDLVSGVEHYPDFLPWCVGARILKREGDVIYADLVIGWKIIREKFRSKVVLKAPAEIHFEYANGPLKYLNGDWRFTVAPGGTLVEFKVDFEFKSRTLAMVMGGVFSELVHRMVGAFEARAKQLYGHGGAPLKRPPPGAIEQNA
jgi:coenzyme Q-binding protein COQ10